jgi:hypothetical protein
MGRLSRGRRPHRPERGRLCWGRRGFVRRYGLLVGIVVVHGVWLVCRHCVELK